MRRLISVFCSIIILISTSLGVIIEMDVEKEETLSFNFTDDEDEILEYIDLSNYRNARIVDYGMNNGAVNIKMNDEYLVLDLYDGVYSEGEVVREKIKTEEVQSIPSIGQECYLEPVENVKSILDVEGDFKKAILKNNQIELTIDENAVGEEGYNKEKLITSKISIEVSEDNRDKMLYSDFYTLKERPKDSNIVVTEIDLGGVASVDIKDNSIRLLFDDGIPVIEETFKEDGHSYFWVDRAIDGSFREKYPNSVYRSDREYFEGIGTYIDDSRLAMDIEFETDWKDYVGFVLDGQRYVYPFTNSFPKEFFEDCVIMNSKLLEFEGQWFNTQKLAVEIGDNVVRYIPEGILYSMGELVKDTKDWGTTSANNPDESKETFYNPISGKMETYVKHFKFYYGPKTKETFGGSFKYPYKAIVEYEHYEPTTFYSGSVTYKYDEIENVSGYLFDGWIKIKYTEKEEVNDYPPSAPYNVFYNNNLQELAWVSGKDDYTNKEQLIYEVEVKLNDKYQRLNQVKGVTKYGYENGQELDFRVRTKDENNQVSEWAYSNDSSIEIIGNIKPHIVEPGDIVDISAIVKSLAEIEEVVAVSEELNINEQLLMQTQRIPNATEVSFNLLNHTGKEPWLLVDDMYYANVDNNKQIDVKKYASNADTEKTTLNIEVPGNIRFTDNGTFILPNQNYLDIPVEISSFNGGLWYFYSMCNLKFVNKITNDEESFIQFVNDVDWCFVGKREKVEITPYIKINLFEYIDGKPSYQKIPVDFESATKPIAVTWKTEDNLTKFTIYVDGKYFYNYEISTDKLKENIKCFSTYSLSKSMDKMQKNSVGYQYHIKSKFYNWTNMYKSASLSDLSFLGYKLISKKASELYDEYNNSTMTRDVNRLVFLDEAISDNAIKLYLSKIKSTNLLIQKRKNDTVFAKDIQEINSEFLKENIKIDENAKNGTYDVVVYAVDKMGNVGNVKIPLIVEENKKMDIKKEDIDIGRFFYVDNNFSRKAVEELSFTKSNLDTKGFICAGETLAIVLDDDIEVDSIVIDFEGDSSIKECDELTKKFLVEELNYEFPLTLKENGNGVFLYRIPYGTKQTLESWATLREKSGDFEYIENDKLFSRCLEPYKLKIKVDDEEFIFKIDIFERWDTVLNRNATKYILNANQKWRKII